MIQSSPEVKELFTVFRNEFSKEIFDHTYRYGDETISDALERVAIDLAQNETDPKNWARKFEELLTNFKFVPGGRILSNAGIPLRGTTYINCFVDGFKGKNQDSMEGIMDALKRQALILKSEGGYGFCADVMRPYGAFIGGIGNNSPGSVEFLNMWDMQSAVITKGTPTKSKNKNAKGKIRKGAQMVTLSTWHPDIERFITAKQTPGVLTKFNMSVLADDIFMHAVKNNKPWHLVFPDTTFELYDDAWDGNLHKWIRSGYPTITYKTYEDANELWDIIMESTYNRNEPGILFSDTINKMNNLHYCEYISATNPCGEQPLPPDGVCLLGSINLTQYLNVDMTDFNYEKLGHDIPIAVRMMDNVNDITYVPLEGQRINLEAKRRIGLGIMGYGSALMMMRITYGGKKALELTDKLMSFIANTAYQASALLSKEKGSFILFNKEEYLKSEFVKTLDLETKEMIGKYGMRNSHLLSIQPTGNTSIFANIVSGGLEPLFLPEYNRTHIVPHTPEGLNVPKKINWANATSTLTGPQPIWNWIKEGDENLLRTEFDGSIYKIDQSRGLLKETHVEDYAVGYLKSVNKWNPDAKWATTTDKLSIDAHINTMAVISKYIDSAMSKTVNLPNNYPLKDFKKLYMSLYDIGTIKGATTYRAGTMTSVLSEAKIETDPTGRTITIKHSHAPKRPKDLPCDIYHPTVNGNEWVVIVGILDKDPYEVFAFKTKNLRIPKKYDTGTIVKRKKNHYDLHLDDDFILEDVKSHFNREEEEALTRMISTSLRHGAQIEFIYDQLQKSEGTVVSFSKAVARTLKKYIKDDTLLNTTCDACNTEGALIFQEGCMVCKHCGDSKCV